MKKRTLTRRTVLRGILSGTAIALGLPLLNIMLDEHGTSLANGDPLSKRFGIFFWGNGIIHDHWNPQRTGMDWTLPMSLEPFGEHEGLKPYVTLITNANHAESNPGHIPARGIALSSSHDMTTGINGTGTYRGQNHPEPSVDTIVANAWKDHNPLGVVAVGVCRQGPYKSNSSWLEGGSTYNRHESDPNKVFRRLFSNFMPPMGEVEPTQIANAALEQSLLDVVLDDARTLQKKLGHIDRQRLEAHLEGLRSIEKRLEQFNQDPQMVSGACMRPEEPNAPEVWANNVGRNKKAKNKLMADIMAMGIACDLVKVFSYEFSATQSMVHYPEVGVDSPHHEYSHVRTTEGELNRAKIVRFIMENFAYFANQLKALPEGDGNVLDNTLILGTSEHGDAARHQNADHPYILLGKASGRIKAGMHHRIDGSNRDAPKVLLTAVRAVGVDIQGLGQRDGNVNRYVSSTIDAIENKT